MLFGILLFSACDALTDTGAPPPIEDGCPSGMSVATGELGVTRFLLDQLSVTTNWDPEIRDGLTPAACMRDDGTGGQLLLTMLDAPIARLEISEAVAGSADLNNESPHLEIELILEDGRSTLTAGHWQSGVWEIGVSPSELTLDLDAIGANDEHSLSVQLSGTLMAP